MDEMREKSESAREADDGMSTRRHDGAPSSTAGSAWSGCWTPFRPTGSVVDFPSFVADLVEGGFEAVVDASIQQMEAYGELLAPSD